MRPLSILAVDDDPRILELLKHCLNVDGHFVTTVNSAAQALRKLKSRHFHVLVTENLLADLRGEELAIRAKQLAPDLRVLMLTGAWPWSFDEGSTWLNVDVVLEKPFRLRDLRRAVNASD